ncbi:protein of unknown function DUF89 [Desulfofarcimen acetoxidans DSM 771]|jgi:uncharacterized protein with ATP-grasp and redox domains|uniref:Damage-control phosphatase ARMT1-like metal-binding domain-containing protein n=1 Tax=Desulfofarcimen acetoxidans (strain ATCC 49208 / DSM 771 / KCTC 5769 / VKM B-1644 / 5575) TaxID=485916 RepID=C8W2F7_DESAS|nr:ARMT1-like domain-containing protein [Desulfofarcimen acetoxidans]ACV63641.1 protein of unknown function DUF89 [Desulfofarcimen acetoxidans DSM 771]
MRTFVDCVPCYLKQAIICMTIAGASEDRQHRILYELMDTIKGFDRDQTPCDNSTEILLQLYKSLGMDDPYREAKRESNDLALSIFPKLKVMLENSTDRLYDSLKFAVAGNVIDLGINKTFDIDESLRQSKEAGFARDDYEKFVAGLNNVDRVLILGDNSGEIVFDKLLVEELVSQNKKVTYVVKGAPILNDATVEDAEYVEMHRVAEVITTGSQYLGTSLANISPELLQLLQKTDLIISKGQANFESLEQEAWARERIFFLLKIKCDCVAEVAGARLGDLVFFTRDKVAI